MKFVCLLFIIAFSAQSAGLPPRWRVALDGGITQTFYEEKQDSLLFEDRNVEQQSSHFNFTYLYYLFPPYVDFSVGIDYSGVSNHEADPVTDKFDMYKAFAQFGAIIPWGDYFQLRLVFEYFYSSMIVEDNDFGFINLSGYQLYPEFEFLPFGSTRFLQISPFVQFPLWSNSEARKETMIGIKFSIPFSGQGQQFPTFAYQSKLRIRLYYKEQILNYREEGYIASDFNIRQYAATIGFSF